MNWEELSKMESGHIIKDWFDEGVRCLIVRGPAALCMYLGVPKDHPLAGFYYDDISIECHGGLTFSGEGDGKFRPKDFYWYGWDYGHCDDYSFYYDLYNIDFKGSKKWLPDMVEKDSWMAIYEFKKLMKLAEKIKASSL